MKILHVGKFNEDRANGIRTVLPNHVIEQAKYEEVLFQNVLPYQIENLKYQVPFQKENWPFNIKNLDGENFIPDLVVFHGYYHFEMIGLSKKLVKNRIPYIVVPHVSLTKKAQRKKRLKKIVGNILFFNKFLKNACGVQFLSQNEYETSKVNNKKFIGTNGINLPNKSKNLFNQEQIKFIYIGRLDIFHKGLDLLFEAIAIKKDFLRKSNCKFYIYGPAIKDVDVLKNLIKKENLEDLIILQGPVYDIEKEQVLLDADVFVQTSRFEGMPMGILEALSYGIPCLITRGTTLGELVERYEAGWVAETTVEGIANQLELVIEQKKLFQKKSNNAINLIEENFNWTQIAKETIKNYKYLCGISVN